MCFWSKVILSKAKNLNYIYITAVHNILNYHIFRYFAYKASSVRQCRDRTSCLKASGGGAFPATKHVFSNTKINLEIKDKLTLNSLAVFVTRKSIS